MALRKPEFPADNPNGFKWYEALLQDDAFRSSFENVRQNIGMALGRMTH